ncbi:hypothetical protein DRP05_09560 [Archaeoglobales archaeon]|nr:MAG: hypothetical protein DRP05_09560 [Archaeoglobales archaeon]
MTPFSNYWREVRRAITGKAKVRVLLDCGFEGDFRLNVRSVQVKSKENILKIAIDGANGETEIELNQDKETLQGDTFRK